MAIIEINKHPSQRELAWFSLLPAALGAIVAAVLWAQLSGGWPAAVALGTGAALTAACLLWPPLRRPVYLAWMYAAFPIGWLLSHLLLAIVYYLVLTPAGLLMRLLGRDPLRRRFERSRESYWQPRPENDDTGRYFRQF